MERRQVNRENHPRRMPPPLVAIDVHAKRRDAARSPRRELAAAGRGTNHTTLRAINAVLGGWLFLSAFLWPHSEPAFVNSVFVGALLAVCGLLSHRSMPRLMCGSLGAWLVLSTLAIRPRMELTFWHNLLVGVAVLAVTFLPARRQPRLRTVK